MKFPTIFLFLISVLANAGATEKPNVLFIVSDDLNYALSSSGHPECETPNLDAFADRAVSFSRAYCQFPLCGPSRASILSGQYPNVNGVNKNKVALAPERVTLPRHFRNHGYWTGRVSKLYHMGIPTDIITGSSGSDHAPSWDIARNITALETMTPGKIIDYADPDAPLVFPAERERWKEAHAQSAPYQMPREARGQYTVVEVADRDAGLLADTMAADEAIELLSERAGADDPFFLAVGFVRPHFPFIATESRIADYDAEQLRYPEFPEDDFDDMPRQAISDRKAFPERSVKELRRGYYGAVTFMDQQFGRLMAALDRLQLREKTIVVFLSDHGYLLGEHEMYKKSKLWEEAIHVPLLIARPGQTGGTTCDRFVELIDLYPTLVELVGLPAEPGAQGLSLVSLLEDPDSHRPEKPDALIQVSNGFGLRSGKWAYLWFPATKKDPEAAMLYDMEVDPQQFNNLATQPAYADEVNRLDARLRQRILDAESSTE